MSSCELHKWSCEFLGCDTMNHTEQPDGGRKYDEGKTRFDLLDPRFAEDVAKILTFGAKKYESNNWQKVEPFNDRYYAALMRHITAWRRGERNDSESGLPHLAHAACCLFFLSWKERYSNEKPDEK